ncbi:unnamed protein product [Gongylonema pulchrum]|uniref:EF-hand_14 domain-containing protein n=1 Tax=Gongylonema pulchrum TaxID=637853 RepID=A0A183CZF7_9BILA|nr:unnamed protein product [Gongylonema pulchrum]
MVTVHVQTLYDAGIRRDDPRLEEFLRAIRHEERKQSVTDPTSNEPISEKLDREMFKRCVGDAIGIIARALKGQLVIPDWHAFSGMIGDIFDSCQEHFSKRFFLKSPDTTLIPFST